MTISPDKLKLARDEGFTDDQILEIFLENNPDFKNKIDTAKKQKFSSDQIIEILSERQPDSPQPQQQDVRDEGEQPGLLQRGLQSGALGFIPGLISELIQGPVNQPEEGQPGTFQSAVNALLSGGVKGVTDLGRALGPLQPQTTEEQQQFEQFPRQVEDFFPTNEGFLSNTIERGAELFPLIASGGGQVGPAAIRTGLASAAGQGAKELGLGPIGQAVGEIGAFITPSSFLKEKINLNLSQKELGDFLRKRGITEAQLAPAITEESLATRFLTKISKKGKKAQTILSDSRKAIGEIFNDLKATPKAQSVLTFSEGEGLIDSLSKKLKDLPSSLRSKIMQDFREFRASARSGADIINLWQDINSTAKGEFKQLGTLKEPLSESLQLISPELFNDFKLTNKAFSNVANLSARLKPSKWEGIFTIGEIGTLLTGLFTGNVALLGEVASVEGSRRIAQNLLLNPRFKNLMGSFVDALNSNKVALASNLQSDIRQELIKESPEAALLFDKFNVEEFIERTSRQ